MQETIGDTPREVFEGVGYKGNCFDRLFLFKLSNDWIMSIKRFYDRTLEVMMFRFH